MFVPILPTVTYIITCLMMTFGVGRMDQLQNTVIERCTAYIAEHPEITKDCSNLWKIFVATFNITLPCSIANDNYDAFIAAASHPIDTKMILLWSGVESTLLVDYKNVTGMITVESTLAGAMFDRLPWCVQDRVPQADNNCSDEYTCPKHTYYAFWDELSFKFVSRAEYIVHVILNGGILGRPTFQNTSTFGSVELPTILNNSAVYELQALISYENGSSRIESCSYGPSLQQLRNTVIQAEVLYSCLDSLRDILDPYCPMGSDNIHCKNLRNELSDSSATLYCQPILIALTFIVNLHCEIFR